MPICEIKSARGLRNAQIKIHLIHSCFCPRILLRSLDQDFFYHRTIDTILPNGLNKIKPLNKYTALAR